MKIIKPDETALIIIAVLVSIIFHVFHYPNAIRSPSDEYFYYLGIIFPFVFPVFKILNLGGRIHAPKQ